MLKTKVGSPLKIHTKE